MQVDGSKVEELIRAAEGCEFVFNGLPLDFNMQVMEASLEVGAHYLDLAGPMEEVGFIESYRLIMTEWHERFKAKNLQALVGCGIAPGLANVVVRESVERMDSCDFIGMYFYDGFLTNRFIPFWWSPEVAIVDMGEETFRFENGKHVTDTPFSRPEMMSFKGIDHQVKMVDHEHDEPVTMGLLADTVLKGAQNIEFKYGGPQIELCETLYKMGLLSLEPTEVKGVTVRPIDVVINQVPRAPVFPEEIAEVIAEGIMQEEGVFLIRVKGVKDGKPLTIESSVCLPGLVESYERSGLTHESYSTGQCAAVFSKLLVEGRFEGKGLFVPEQLDDASRGYVFSELGKLDITIDEEVLVG
jgi:saccharopine dehydrogenase-like NADP-dependent oxidoreductase